MSPIQERLAALRREMKKFDVSVYIVPTSDPHASEYVCPHFRSREYVTGFTGSAGTAIITQEEAALWTDGRYFIQAEKQLEGTGILLMKSGEPGVPKESEYVEEHLKAGERLGFDGRCMSAENAAAYRRIAEKCEAGLCVSQDLVGNIWTDRPPIQDGPVMVLDEKWAGESAQSKISRVREQMAKYRADVHVMASLCDIAWLLNIRGDDIAHVPVILSFLLMTREQCVWYVRPEVIRDEVGYYLDGLDVEIREYDRIYEDIATLQPQLRVLVDMKNINYRMLAEIPKGVTVLNGSNPTEQMKCIKNGVELCNLRAAHLKESIAFTKFIYWVKKNAGKIPITEISAAEYLDERRREQANYLQQSFEPICAYGEHAAIVHYSPTEESNAQILPKGFLLVDAGGHYLEGTTDTTRTIALGELTEEEKRMFTAVCRGNMNLANAKFLYGCTGMTLDILCREPIWQLDADYKHGTGHGVGYLLSVHEGPNGFRWKPRKGETLTVLEAGMITTDEPGVYVEGKFGIRTENELICCKGVENEYGQFMHFENMTLIPIDLDAILPEEMNYTERSYLNAYHRRVYAALTEYLTDEEREWLREATREI